MSEPEPLIDRFELKDWVNPHYTGSSPAKRSVPVLEERYRGFLRCAVAGSSADNSREDADADGALAA